MALTNAYRFAVSRVRSPWNSQGVPDANSQLSRRELAEAVGGRRGGRLAVGLVPRWPGARGRPSRRRSTSRASCCGWTAAPATSTPSTSSPTRRRRPRRVQGRSPPRVPGIQISEHFPKFAKLMQHAAILRGMSTDEADHGRARVYLHTGYKPGAGGVAYPASARSSRPSWAGPTSPLPNFVVTGTPLGKHDFLTDPGYLGPRHQPLVVNRPGARAWRTSSRWPGATTSTTASACWSSWSKASPAPARPAPPTAHQTTLPPGASELMRSDKAQGVRPGAGAGRARAGLRREPVRPGLPAGPPAGRGRACRSSRCTWPAGTRTTRTSPTTPWGLMTQVDDGMSALVERPEGARPARHHAGHLDGRVRPHAAHQQERRPRPLPEGLEHACWSAAASRAAR